MKTQRQCIMVLVSLVCGAGIGRFAPAQEAPENMFANPSFELGRGGGWHISKSKETNAGFTVNEDDARSGRYSAKVAMGQVKDWGAQFGQSFEAGQKGKTYTFAVFAKSTGGPVEVDLQIERSAKPYDRAVQTKPFTLTSDKWTELHVTFKVEKDFPQGWFAYISCMQPNAEFRADVFRLYEGEYVSYEEEERQIAAVEGVHLFDTGTHSPEPLASDALAKRNGWTQLPEDKTDHDFKGDTVVMNRRIAVVLRRSAPGAEVYSGTSRGFQKRAVLIPAVDPPVKLSSVRIEENNPTEMVVEVRFGAVGLRLGLNIGQVFLKTEPIGDVKWLRIEAPCRFMALPDFFADDIVVDARDIPVPTAELPGENFLLHMLGDEEAILMAVCQSRDRDFRIALSGKDNGRMIRSSEIAYGKEGKIWVAILADQHIWHMRNIAKDDKDKRIPLDWTQPFPAQWRVDWRRDNGLTDSWEMVTERPDGKFTKHGWFGGASTLPKDRKKWTSTLGRFKYPCWIDRSGRGYLQPLKKVLTFEGPAVLYPINRVKKTPLDRHTVVDVVRDTLGVGPCEYVLDIEAQQTTYKGIATCGARDRLNPIYKKKQQKHKKEVIEKTLTDVLIFVKYIRGRIEQYVAWGHEMVKYLKEQKKTHPELADFLNEMEELTKAIDVDYAKRKERIKTPAYVADLCDEFRRDLMDYKGADAFEKCKKITAAIVVVGGNQDALVGECRVAAKRLRQRAGLAMAKDPRVAEIAREIRRRTHQIMRNPASYEAPRY